jgi:putative transposase
MTQFTPDQEWWTAEEIALGGLPDMPATKRGVNALADRLHWRGNRELARRRHGRGGGWEYCWRLFPARAQRKLLEAAATPSQPVSTARHDVWAWFDALPEAVKAKAQERLAVIQKVEAMVPVLGRHNAVMTVAELESIGARTIWNWLGAIEGVRTDDRLAYLAPRHRAQTSRPASKDCDPEFFDLLKSDYLRFEQPSFADCYRRSVRVAKSKGWVILPERTMRRKLDAAVSQATQVLARKGIDAVKRLYPAQVRDKTALVALEAVNADFHKFDVFVRWPARPGEAAQILRPQMVAFQDIYSGRILSWRLDQTPNSTAVLLAAGDMIEAWGIPQHVLLDNGREFAAKSITGGAATRYRFKVKEDDIPGLFTGLGCTIHWATPYSGQSKPIERAFRDMCGSIAKDPRFAGAWTGNRPDAQPENYGSTAIDLETFLMVLAEGIEEHNNRVGRRSEVAWGRSFAEVFDESYETAPIRKATEAQRRLWLLGAVGQRAGSVNGSLKFQGNEFWAEWMQSIAGQRVILRFDPADMWSGVHVYSNDNAYLGHAPCRMKAGFFDMDEARSHARARNAWLAAEKKAAAAHQRFKVTEIGAELDALTPDALPAPEAKVVRGVFGKAPPKSAVAAEKVDAPDLAHVQAAMIEDLSARRGKSQPSEETPRERFRRALELERQEARGEQRTIEQQRWLSLYQATPEYRAERMLWDDMGDAIFG